MFCPKCGQQQASTDVRFCSRCGFHLGTVAELLPVDGVPATRQGAKALVKRKETRVGAKFIFYSVVLLPFVIALSVIFDSPLPLLAAPALFTIGLAQVLYVRLFGESLLPERRKESAELKATEQQYNLPTTQNASLPPTNPKKRTTAELLQPPSVTEHTTTLLDRKQS